MFEAFDIYSSSGSYLVRIDPGGSAKFLPDCRHDVIVADSFFEDHPMGRPLASARAAVYCRASESIKSLDAVPALIERARDAGANRQTRFVAFGGGTVQDLTAFAASIYMRGVAWAYVPTTVLGMVDSCIGGKSSINVGPYKNLVGTFHPPAAVFIDPALASTLPLDQQASGLIEAAKICFCRGPESFRGYLACQPRPGMDPAGLSVLVSRSLRAKKWFIEIDEFDRRERLLLNFGHTFGHALEGASGYGIPHGTAVGLGMLCALAFVRQGLAGRADPYAEAAGVLALEEHVLALLHSLPELSLRLSSLSLDAVLQRFASDKKHKQESYILVLVDPSGRVVLESVEKSPATLGRIGNAIRSVIDRVVKMGTA